MKPGILLVASFLFILAVAACNEAEAPSPDDTPTAESTSIAPTETPGTAEPSPTPAATAVPNVCDVNPSPVNPASPNVIVQSPEEGDVVTSPMRITGEASVFEAQFNVALYGELGGVIAEASGMTEEGQRLAPFEMELPFAVSREQPACLWVYAISAQDGSRIDVVQVSIALAPPVQPTPAVTRTASPMSAPSQ